MDDYPTSHDSSDDEEDHHEHREQTVHYLTLMAYIYRTTGEDIYGIDPKPDDYAEQFTLDYRYCTTYQGELWDTGAAQVSTVGKS